MDKLTWIHFHAFCWGDERWTLACDLLSGRVCLTSHAERKLRCINNYIRATRTELDTIQSLLVVRQRVIDNAQFHVAQLGAATLELIESKYPYDRLNGYVQHIFSPSYFAIDDTGRFFSCGAQGKSLSCYTWGGRDGQPSKKVVLTHQEGIRALTTLGLVAVKELPDTGKVI